MDPDTIDAPQAPDTQVDSVVLEDKPFVNGGGFSSTNAKSYGRIVYVVYREEDYGRAMYVKAQKIYPDSRPSVTIDLGSLSGGKEDTIGSPFVSGNDLWVPLDEHASVNGVRVSRRGFRVARGFVEGDNPAAHEDEPGVNIGGEPQVTAQEVVDALTAALQNGSSPLSGQLDRHIKNNSQIGAERAIQSQSVVTLGNIRDILYQFFMDRVYQTFAENAPGFWEWLRGKVSGKS